MSDRPLPLSHCLLCSTDLVKDPVSCSRSYGWVPIQMRRTLTLFVPEASLQLRALEWTCTTVNSPYFLVSEARLHSGPTYSSQSLILVPRRCSVQRIHKSAGTT